MSTISLLPKLLPLTPSELPGGPAAGASVTPGGTMKLLALFTTVPLEMVTAITPVLAPLGTVVVIWVSELTVKVAETPLKVTFFAPVKPQPVIMTLVPGGPLSGVKPVSAGQAACPALCQLLARALGVVASRKA